jgi:redox-regulated HSP33 family molecular chaperone
VTTTGGNGTNAQLRATINGTEIPGSRSAVTLSALGQFIAISKSLIASVNASDVLTVQLTGSGTGIRLFGTANSTLTVTRIQ